MVCVVKLLPVNNKMSFPSTGQGLSKLKKKHFRVKHQKVKLFRANEPFLSVFMWGINHTVSTPSPLQFFALFMSKKLFLFADKRTDACYYTSDAAAR